MTRQAIVTLAIGEQHLSYWRHHCEASWRAYAERHGYDLFAVTEALDRSPLAASRSPAWQKCLVLSQEFAAGYQQIVLLDCDIVINAHTSPPATDQVPVECVGGVIAGSHIQEDLRIVLLSRLRRKEFAYERGDRIVQDDLASYYRHFGLQPQQAGIVQTGVLVASPTHHRQLFEQVYRATYGQEHRSFEQVPLSHALLSSGVFQGIDSRFNSVFYETMLVHFPYLGNTRTPSYELLASYAVQSELANNFFLHFAYLPHFASYLPAAQPPQ